MTAEHFFFPLNNKKMNSCRTLNYNLQKLKNITLREMLHTKFLHTLYTILIYV